VKGRFKTINNMRGAPYLKMCMEGGYFGVHQLQDPQVGGCNGKDRLRGTGAIPIKKGETICWAFEAAGTGVV